MPDDTDHHADRAPDVLTTAAQTVHDATTAGADLLHGFADTVADTAEAAQEAAADLAAAIELEIASPQGQTDLQQMESALPSLAGEAAMLGAEITALAHGGPADLVTVAHTILDAGITTVEAAGHAADLFSAASDFVAGVARDFEAIQEGHHGGGGPHDGTGPDMTVSFAGHGAHHVHFESLDVHSHDGGHSWDYGSDYSDYFDSGGDSGGDTW